MMDCKKCRYYQVTWDKDSPHGCRAFGFKGKMLPIVSVRQASSGADCALYRKKLPQHGKSVGRNGRSADLATA